jgi:hypothetical protein
MSVENYGFDGIVCLAGMSWGPGSDTETRADYAIKWYQQGLAPTILFTGAYPALLHNRPGTPYAEHMQRRALGRGVSTDDILVEPDSLTTIENGLLSKPLLPGRRLLVVSSDNHIDRSVSTLQHVWGTDYELTPAQSGQSRESHQRLHEKVADELTKLIFWQTKAGDDATIAAQQAEIFTGRGRDRIFTPQQVAWNAGKSYLRRQRTTRRQNKASSERPF